MKKKPRRSAMLFLFLVFKPGLHDHQARHHEGPRGGPDNEKQKAPNLPKGLGQIQSNKGLFHRRNNDARHP